jgi:hypothetical protein
MKKVVDILLILLLLAAIGYLFFVLGGDVGGVWFSTPTPTLRSVLVVNATATITQVVSLIPSQTAAPSATSRPTSTASLTATATPAPSSTQSPTTTPAPSQSATPTVDAAQAALDEEIRAGIEQGDHIVRAVELYHQTEGAYPPALQDLIPDLLPEIPVTTTGGQFFYRLFDPDEVLASEIYWVAFKVTGREHVTCTYFRRLDYWDCNYSSP